MPRGSLIALLSGLALLVGSQASAIVKIYKHDQFSTDLGVAAQELGTGLVSAQAGYAQGEAFGVIFTPAATDYPVKIIGLQLVTAGPCVTEQQNKYNTPADIEMYFGDAAGPAPPQATPTWSINTGDLLIDAGGGSDALKALKGNTGLAITFDDDDVDGHPPLVGSGRIWVAVRFPNEATDLSAEWGQCTPNSAPNCAVSPPSSCGCQGVGTLHDPTSTANVNVINHLTSGLCTGEANQWSYAEKLGIKGDIVLRLIVETPDTTGCTPSCTGKSCGVDGCGGFCGTCSAGQSCVQGSCQAGGCNTTCAGKVCGDDGCGGVCGLCGTGDTCEVGVCVDETGNPGCQPSCAGKVCGDDGCGGICGVSCENGQSCEAGVCVTTPVGSNPLTIESLSPSFGVNDASTDVTISGTGFKDGLEARLGAEPLGIVRVFGDTIIDARVPEGMTPGSYNLVVINPDEKTATLPDAFVVAAPTGGGCSGGGGEGPLGPLAALMLGWWLLMALRRRQATAPTL